MSIISALVAATYILSVVTTLFITVCAFDKPLTRELFDRSLRKYLIIVGLLTSTVSEMPLHLIILKFISIKLVGFLGGFRYTLSSIAYLLDIITMAALGVLFYEMVTEKSVAAEALKSIDSKSESITNSLGIEDMKKLLNPIWSPDNIRIHSNITYATNEEIRDALNTTNQDFDQPRKMMLDIYTHDTNKKASAPNNLQPVLVHLHGGSWRTGSKDIFYPHMQLLVKENNWVAVNVGYRLAPKNAYPTHLMDVKRALRWVKQNIASFGGDPNFIILSGDSSGAHLAAMASMTANNPQYQPGFEQIDTSVRGVISLSGVLEITENAHRAAYFSKEIANLDKVDMDFLNQHTPMGLIDKAKQEKNLVPFLLFAGERDAITRCNISKSFKAVYDQAAVDSNSLSCSLVLSPGGHHISYIGWSPRSIFTARIIQSWCTKLYITNK